MKVSAAMLGATALAAGGAAIAGGSLSVSAVTHRASSNNTWCEPLRTFSQPPAGFDATSASADELQRYGYPQRPSGADPGAEAAWRQLVGALRYYDLPDPVCSDNTHYVSRWFTSSWAGHQVPSSYVGDGSDLTWSQSTWTQPSVPGDGSYPDWHAAPDASFWTGLGGNLATRGPNLIQAGADSIDAATPVYKFWTEDFPLGTAWEGPSVSAGDSATAYVRFDGSEMCYYLLGNLTTGHYSSFENSCPYVASKAADFINERLNGLKLPNFGSTSVSGDYFGNGHASYDLTSNSDEVVMSSDCTASGTILSSPSSIVDTGFTQAWQAASPVSNSCTPHEG